MRPSVAVRHKAGCHSITLRGLGGLLRLRALLDQQSFGMRDCANAQRDGKGVQEEGLDRHGFEEWLFGGAAPLTPSKSQPFW